MPIFIVIENEFLSLIGSEQVEKDVSLSIDDKRCFLYRPQASNSHCTATSKFAFSLSVSLSLLLMEWLPNAKPKQPPEFTFKNNVVYFYDVNTIDANESLA